jgi:hypothetical protein
MASHGPLWLNIAEGSVDAGMPNRDADVRTLDLSWIRGKTDDWGKTIEEVELIAVEIMVDEDIGSREWVSGYIPRVGRLPHGGDCSLCRSWLTAPITCDACVYDRYMLKAWNKKRESMSS